MLESWDQELPAIKINLILAAFAAFAARSAITHRRVSRQISQLSQPPRHCSLLCSHAREIVIGLLGGAMHDENAAFFTPVTLAVSAGIGLASANPA